MNIFKTFLFLFLLTALFMFVGAAIGGKSGATIAFVIAFLMNMFAYWNSDKIVLRMHNAQEADKTQYASLYSMTQKLVEKSSMPMPKLYIMHEDTPNAFATGRNPSNAAVAVTTGLWNMLNQEEIEGVVAHELAHIKNYDTLISTVASMFASAISMLANMFMFASLFGRGGDNRNPLLGLVVMIIAPIVAGILQMSISRQREYIADKTAGDMTGNPLHLASALQKLENYAQSRRVAPKDVKQSTAHMFIFNHLSDRNADSLFSTHPSSYNRIVALQAQAVSMGVNSVSFSSAHTPVFSEKKQALKPKEEQKYSKEERENNPWL